jgi:uncharacterized protein (AIM24 family)
MEYKIEHGPVFTIVRISLKQGEQFRAEAGAMVSMSPTLKLEAKTTGEGLVCEYTGPGKMWVQTRALSAFAQEIEKYIHKR